MKSILNLLKSKDLTVGYLYFYVHFALEVVCFFYLSRVTNNSSLIWIVPFIYDGLAFVPQGIIGYISDRFPKIPMGLIGVILLISSYLIYGLTDLSIFTSLIILCLGNAFVHVAGAETTLKCSKGKLSTSAIYVAGGSFGIVTGRLLATSGINPLYMLIPILSVIPFIILADRHVTKESSTKEYNYVKDNISTELVVIIALLVVIVRSYMGYGIPTSWNKTMTQTVIMFSMMGLGKALGGILSDLIGIKKVAIYSTLLSIPFLCFGNNIMIISLIGIMLFSMTMSITLAILASKLKRTPGLAFGITTVGLFLGTVPIFYVRLNMTINVIIIVIASMICALLLNYVLKDSKK